MSFFVRYGRALLLLASLLVGAVCLSGCVDDNGANSGGGTTPGTTPGGGGNNTVGNNNCTSAATCKSKEMPDGKIWMTENLNIAVEDSWCYGDSSQYCAKYGRLYTWNTAKTVCPSGWRLPDTSDWRRLVEVAGGQSTAGKTLRSTSGWKNSGNGTDDFGFSALPSGRRSNMSFFGAGSNGYWWTATESGIGSAYSRNMEYPFDDVYELSTIKTLAHSVRCVAD